MRGFTDTGRWEKARRTLFFRFFRSRRDWHNREYTGTQTIERAGDGSSWVHWKNHGEIHTLPLHEVQRYGDACAIAASGPSVGKLDHLERMFNVPVACVNGSVALPIQLGVSPKYYFVTDSRFVEQKPELFVKGVELAETVFLNPKTIFTAMQRLPGLLDHAPVYLLEDIRRPFKHPRDTPLQMKQDPRLMVHANGSMAYSFDLTFGVYPAGTVVYQAIQVLFGMNYGRILMFGVDLGGQKRFYQEAVPSPSDLDQSYETTILPAFELVHEYCEQSGKKLLNCSMESRLPASVIPKLEGSKALAMLENIQSKEMLSFSN